MGVMGLRHSRNRDRKARVRTKLNDTTRRKEGVDVSVAVYGDVMEGKKIFIDEHSGSVAVGASPIWVQPAAKKD